MTAYAGGIWCNIRPTNGIQTQHTMGCFAYVWMWQRNFTTKIAVPLNLFRKRNFRYLFYIYVYLYKCTYVNHIRVCTGYSMMACEIIKLQEAPKEAITIRSIHMHFCTAPPFVLLCRLFARCSGTWKHASLHPRADDALASQPATNGTCKSLRRFFPWMFTIFSVRCAKTLSQQPMQLQSTRRLHQNYYILP